MFARHSYRMLLPGVFLTLGMSTLSYAATDSVLNRYQTVGTGTLSWFGFTVYDATLYTKADRYASDREHALKITYRFNFSAEELANRSIEEIEAIFGSQQQREEMQLALTSVFCDVREGDNIVGLHLPEQGAEFYCNGKLHGKLNDPVLAHAFFSIWLDPATSEPELRRQLLGADE